MKKKLLVVSPSIPQCLQKQTVFEIIHAPLISLRPVEISQEQRLSIKKAKIFLITSTYAAKLLSEISPSPELFYTVGKSSAKTIQSFFPLSKIIIAEKETQEGVWKSFLKNPSTTLLWPKSTKAREYLSLKLTKLSIEYQEIPFYEPVFQKVPLSLFGIDSVFFGCPSSVDAFFAQFSAKEMAHLRMIPIGPITQKQLQKQGAFHDRICDLRSSLRNG